MQRRDFLKTGLAAGGASLVSGCGGTSDEKAPRPRSRRARRRRIAGACRPSSTTSRPWRSCSRRSRRAACPRAHWPSLFRAHGCHRCGRTAAQLRDRAQSDALAIADELDGNARRAVPADAAARHSGADQGQHRHRRPHADLGRVAGAGRLDRSAGRRHRRAPARRRRGDPGQDEPERVGQLPLDPLHQRLERPRRPDPQSVRTGPQRLRLEFGLGRSHRRQPVRDRGRHGDRRIDRLPIGRPTGWSASSRRWDW